jgi:hypothetical protein
MLLYKRTPENIHRGEAHLAPELHMEIDKKEINDE